VTQFNNSSTEVPIQYRGFFLESRNYARHWN
jgi:hypothetical protein